MERINPPHVKAFMLKKGKLLEAPATLQELGIYSSVFIDVTAEQTCCELMLEHNIFGKLLRTKEADTDEGGVVVGFSVVDQPWLTKEIGPLTSVIKPLVENF